MHKHRDRLILWGLVAMFALLVNGGLAAISLAPTAADPAWRGALQSVGMALVAASPFCFFAQLLGWAGEQQAQRDPREPARLNRRKGPAEK